MSAAVRLLERLDGVRQTAPDRWVARCPAHDDRTASLSIRDIDDRVLVHDFAGCNVGDVLAALGLQLSDLYEKPLAPNGRRHSSRSRIPPRDVLMALDHEVTAAAIIIEAAASHPLSDLARDRLALAVRRIGSAAAYVGRLA